MKAISESKYSGELNAAGQWGYKTLNRAHCEQILKTYSADKLLTQLGSMTKIQISQVYIIVLTDRQTDGQTNEQMPSKTRPPWRRLSKVVRLQK